MFRGDRSRRGSSGYRTNASTGGARRRRARRPEAEPLEGRTLMAYVAFADANRLSVSLRMQAPDIPGGGTSTDTQELDNLNHPVGLNYVLANTSSGNLWDYYELFEQEITDQLDGTNRVDLRLEDSQAASYQPVASAAQITDSAGTNGSPLAVTVMPGPGEQEGDPVTVQLSADLDFNVNSPTGITSQSSVTYASAGAQGTLLDQTFETGDRTGSFDFPGRPITLFTAVGQTFYITIDNRISGSEIGVPDYLGGATFNQALNVTIAEEPRPDIDVTTASTDDAKSIRLDYSIGDSDLSHPFRVAIYRSPTPTFDSSTAVPIGLEATIPATDGGGAPSTVQGTHTVTVTLPSAIGPDKHGNGAYVFVVSNPPGGDHIPEYYDVYHATPLALPVDIAITSATTDDAKSLDLDYTISDADLTRPFRVAVYRSDSPDPETFDINTAMLVTTSLSLPDKDIAGVSSTALGPHRITVKLAQEIPTAPNHSSSPPFTPHPYLFVVVNPPGDGHVREKDDNNDTNDVLTLGRITTDQLRAIMPGSNASSLIDALNSAMGEWAIITPKRQAAFLGQMSAESDRLGRWRELFTTKLFHLPGSRRPGYAASNEQDYFNYWYSNVNGNGDYRSNDGYTFRGRGPIQITGRANYSAAASALADPSILMNPDQVEDRAHPLVGFRVAAWFWQSSGLNAVADTLQSGNPFLTRENSNTVSLISRRVNGGTNGLLERLKATAIAIGVLDRKSQP